ncbi:MAG: hypothetical protein C5B55_14180 [Blastocatellia bacterium]|nr:MAG: hypothetical protein C5B55_14180 [Blastocatellia bacterium]
MSQWTIHSGGVTGGSHKDKLVGCHITTNDTNTAYEFTDHNPNTVLSTTTGNSLPTPPFTFPTFGLGGYDFSIEVTTLTGGPSNNQAEGNWSIPSPTADPDGTWTAQSGTTTEGDEGDTKSASA